MIRPSESNEVRRRCYALCVGIGTYTNLVNRNLRYAVTDATVISERLADSQRGNFAVTVLTTPAQTTKASLEEAVKHLLSAPDRQAEDLALLYFSCHGDINQADRMFCLLPSDAALQKEEMFDQTTLMSIYDFARWWRLRTIQNIVVLLDVCHSGGAGSALQQFTLNLDAGPNIFLIGAARSDQVARQSSRLQHGLFTHCLLRAFEQPPTSNGWLTVSQIHTFISDELPWFTKEHPTSIQSWSVSVNPNLPLVRNPGYPELAPLPPVWNVPLPRNVFFTGQENLLSQLASMLQQTQKTALTHPHVLSGLGGIGKTQLALEYAYRHRQDYHAVLWGSADTSEALISTFVEIAHALDLPQKDDADQKVIVEAVKTWLMNRPQWLFILDNADDVSLIQEFLPSAFRGHLLLTTRAQIMGKVVGSKLEVEVMRPEIGALLLLRRARMVPRETMLEEIPHEEVTQAKELSEELGGLPLALDQAGAYIEATQCGLADYQQQYRTRRTELLALRNGPTALVGALKDDHPESVATTWFLSFEKVEQASPIAAELLRTCAFLAPDAIPEELLVEALKTPLSASSDAEAEHEEGVGFSQLLLSFRKQLELISPAENRGEINSAVAILRAYSLIQRNPTSKTLSLHKLVQAMLQNTMEEREWRAWAKRAVLVVSMALPKVENANWSQWEQLLPHAQACAELIKQHDLRSLEAVMLLKQAGWYLTERVRYREAQVLLERSLQISKQQREPIVTATIAATIAALYIQQGKYEQAEPLLQQSLEIDAQVHGPEHPETANSLNNLAFLYKKQGKHVQAESLYIRALSIRERYLGTNHPDTASTLNNLAGLYKEQGKYSQAELLYQRALKINEQAFGPNRPETALNLNNLAELYHELGKFIEAETLYQRAVQIWEQQLGVEHPNTTTCLNNLAGLCRDQGKYEQAEALFQRVLSIREQHLGVQHPDIAASLTGLAILYALQRKYEQAELLGQHALEINEQVFGLEHLETASSLNNLAGFCYEQRKYEQAEPLFQRALKIERQVFGSNHPRITTTLSNMAEFYRAQGKLDESEQFYQQVLAIREHHLGPEHTDTVYCINRLAALYEVQGKYEQAESLYERVLTLKGHQLGTEHPDTATSLNNLAVLYHAQGRYAEAEPLLRQTLAIREQLLGAEHSDTATSLNNLAALYENQGRYAEAEPLLKQALAIYQQTLGSEHPTTLTTRADYTALLRKMKQDELSSS